LHEITPSVHVRHCAGAGAVGRQLSRILAREKRAAKAPPPYLEVPSLLANRAHPRYTGITIHPAIAQHRSGIAAICQRYSIRRLEVFGSAARADDFNPENSDADFLVEFAQGTHPDLKTFFGAKAALEKLLGRGVDLVEPGAVRNPRVLESINRSREAIYAA
jgi:predicted nucleotidyltransferase